MMPFGMMGWYGWGSLGLLGTALGMLLNLAVVVGIVWLIVWAVRRFSGGTLGSRSESPREILRARYARGEVTREQYQQMLQDLN